MIEFSGQPFVKKEAALAENLIFAKKCL